MVRVRLLLIPGESSLVSPELLAGSGYQALELCGLQPPMSHLCPPCLHMAVVL